MLYIKGNTLETSEGQYLKTIHCPKKVAMNELETQSDSANYTCTQCEKTLLNTDYLSETQVIDAVNVDPDVCLTINMLNPIFQWRVV